MRTSTHFIHVVSLSEGVEVRIHSIQHGNDLHGSDSAANFRESHDVREQNRYAVEHLEMNEIPGWFEYTLVIWDRS